MNINDKYRIALMCRRAAKVQRKRPLAISNIVSNKNKKDYVKK